MPVGVVCQFGMIYWSILAADGFVTIFGFKDGFEVCLSFQGRSGVAMVVVLVDGHGGGWLSLVLVQNLRGLLRGIYYCVLGSYWLEL